MLLQLVFPRIIVFLFFFFFSSFLLIYPPKEFSLIFRQKKEKFVSQAAEKSGSKMQYKNLVIHNMKSKQTKANFALAFSHFSEKKIVFAEYLAVL